MQIKSERQLLSSTSKRVLRQLQENQSLRIQLFRVRSELRDQHHHFLNSTVNQQMLIEKIITELTLGVKRAKEVRHRGETEILYSAIDHSLGDLHCILDSYGKIRGDWAKTKPDASEVYYERMLKECSDKFDAAQQAIDELSKEKQRIKEESSLKSAQIQFLQGELGKLKQKYDQSMEEMSAIRAEKSKLSQAVSDAQLRLSQYAEELAKLKTNNDTLSHSLKESREVANRHTEYLSNKCEGIQLENRRLIEMHKEQNSKEQQMSKVAADNEKEIQRLSQETHKLRMEIHTLQHKLKEIIDKENKIKHLESIKPKKSQNREALCDLPLSTQNSIPPQQKQRTFKKEVGKMTNKKFNLQTFHEQLATSTTSSSSFFPH